MIAIYVLRVCYLQNGFAKVLPLEHGNKGLCRFIYLFGNVLPALNTATRELRNNKIIL